MGQVNSVNKNKWYLSSELFEAWECGDKMQQTSTAGDQKSQYKYYLMANHH